MFLKYCQGDLNEFIVHAVKTPYNKLSHKITTRYIVNVIDQTYLACQHPWFYIIQVVMLS